MSPSAGPARISVLLYSGPGTSGLSLRLARQTLSALLHPSAYAISLVSPAELINEPWPASTALLVIPGGADRFYAQQLNGRGNAKIRRYVEAGGRFLGLCAGGYYGAARCEWRAEQGSGWDVAGPRELGFFPGTCRGSVKAGFEYGSERGARAVKVRPSEGGLEPFRCYVNGGGVFVGAAGEDMRDKGVEPLAAYDEEVDVDGGSAGAAAVHCKIGQGQAILTGPHPEFDPACLDPDSVPGYAEVVGRLKEDDAARVAFLRACLKKLGLQLGDPAQRIPQLSRMHLSGLGDSVDALVRGLDPLVTTGADGARYIRDEVDTFRLEDADSTLDLDSLAHTLPQLDGASGSETDSSWPSRSTSRASSSAQSFSNIIKRVAIHESPPTTEITPHFDHAAYFAALARHNELLPHGDSAAFGSPLLYGAVVTSTNTLLEKNARLLRTLPTGFAAAATQQVAGRGRGNNAWVSPAGSLVFSVVIRHEAALMQRAPVTFLQYLAGMAVVAGVRRYGDGVADAPSAAALAALPLRLKWPNDIYARDPAEPARHVKVGGVLVNSHYDSAEGSYVCVVGIGLNALNAAPTTSLAALVPPAEPPLRLEPLQASVLAAFAALYARFRASGWDDAMEAEYLASWLHSGQVVVLESEGGGLARICGVSRDWGMLEAEELGSPDGWFGEGWERGGPAATARGRLTRLQSDGNSFDFMKGLIRRKV